MQIVRSTLAALFLSTVSLLTVGCSLSTTSSPLPQLGQALSGSVHGGQQPVVGAHVHLLAANTAGYGQPSLSLLNGSVTGKTDAIGAYVESAAGGSFSVTGDYVCTPATQVYLYATSGDSGSGTNNAIGLLAALGGCPASGTFVASVPFIVLNEVTTVAAAYALAGYAVDPTHVSSSGTPLAQTGIANAFANAANLADLSSGAARLAINNGLGTVTQQRTNTVADILASCINSSGALVGPSNASACYTLFYNATSTGTASGAVPAETATAAINIAHHPASNVAALYGLAAGTAPFQPVLANKPNELTEYIDFYSSVGQGPIIHAPEGLATDASGSVWIAAAGDGSIVELSSQGAQLSPAGGFVGGGLYSPDYIAVDTKGNIWATNHEPGQTPGVAKLSNSGVPLSPPTGFTGGGLNTLPNGIAIDGADNAWVVDAGTARITKFSSAGVPLSPSTGFTGGGLNSPPSIAIDASGNIWFGSPGTSIAELSNNGLPISPSTGYRGGGLDGAYCIAIDANGNAWTGNAENDSLSEFTNVGIAISPTSGYTGQGFYEPYTIAIDGAGNVWADGNALVEFSPSGSILNSPYGYPAGQTQAYGGMAIDGSGNIWIAESGYFGTVREFVGLATPVVTPLAVGVATNSLGTRP